LATNLTPPLSDYGIQNEQSDLRAHVCPLVRRVYVYPTAEGCRAIEAGGRSARPAYQAGVKGATAMGYCVPPFDIRRCVALEVRADAWAAATFCKTDDTSTKGSKAVRFVAGMIRAGVFPLPYVIGECNTDLDRTMQIRGDDIVVAVGANRVHIQVKCDYCGGDKALGGTGNLYLQIAERNPLKKV
jgi:hypothetical protein